MQQTQKYDLIVVKTSSNQKKWNIEEISNCLVVTNSKTNFILQIQMSEKRAISAHVVFEISLLFMTYDREKKFLIGVFFVLFVFIVCNIFHGLSFIVKTFISNCLTL